MPNYIEESNTIEVPAGIGAAGYLQVVQELLDLPRVQEVKISAGGVYYRRFRREDEPTHNVGANLPTLLPSSIVRSRPITEITFATDNAAMVVAQLFAKAHMDGYNPVAFVSGQNSLFPKWHVHSTQIVLPRDEAYGLPLLLDPQIPDEALILCAAYGRRAALVDTVYSYKITIPWSPR